MTGDMEPFADVLLYSFSDKITGKKNDLINDVISTRTINSLHTVVFADKFNLRYYHECWCWPFEKGTTL
jgi:hypothetical protein